MSSTLSSTLGSSTLGSSALRDARARWLGGDADAWAHYAECCRELDAERRTPLAAEPPPRTRIPLAWYRPSAPDPRAIRQ